MARVERALAGTDAADAWQRDQSWRSKPEPPECPEPDPPKALVLRIDSPGGVVSGLNEAVAKMQKLAAKSGVKLVAYVDEMAASAAYAVACACAEVVCPRSAILGSIGVISTMVDQTAAEAEMGLKFVTITSGDRKADGHPHVPIEDDAVAAERARVMELAGQFWEIVSEARGLPISKVEGFQAGIFLGREAKKARLADRVQGWDSLLKRLEAESGLDKNSQTSSTSSNGVTGNVSPRSPRMTALAKLIADTKAKIAKEDDPDKLAALASSLASYKKTEKHVEHVKTEEDDGEEDEEEEEAKGNETDRGDDPEDDEDDDAKKSKKASGKSADEEEAKAMLAVYRAATKATGKTGRSVVGAITALIEEAKAVPALRERVAKIEQRDRKAERENLLARAKAERRISPAEAKTLATKKIDFVKSYLEMRPNAIVA
ncbi:MAG: S49 family peptidase, partial [Candidatus Cybelea sp.]